MQLHLSEFVFPVKGGVLLQGFLHIYVYTCKHIPLCILHRDLHVCVYIAKFLPTDYLEASQVDLHGGKTMAFCVPLLYPLTSRGPVFSWSLFPATPGWASNSQTFQAPSICGLQVDTELLSLWSKEIAFPAHPHICDILACWPHCPQVCPQACPEAVSLCQSFSYVSNRQLCLTLQGSQRMPQQCWAQSSGAQSPAPLFPPQLCPFPQGPLKS